MKFLAAAIISTGIAFSASAHADAPSTAVEGAVKRGEYIFHAAGCGGCHTHPKAKDKPLAGGHPFKTPYGVFYSPNITPDPKHGIGKWSERDFVKAVRHGVSPNGKPYFPVFPYTSYARMTERDAKDLFAYVKTRKAIAEPDKPHDLKWPFGYRFPLWGWQLLFFDQGAFKPDPKKSAAWNRGAYLTALGHCAECHSPRNFLGAIDKEKRFAGTAQAPDGGSVPNITQDKETGIGKWSAGAITDLLSSGMMADGDFVGGAMADVIDNTTGKLTKDDLQAMVTYLKSLPPIRHKVSKKN
ncbi:MAG: cytochrome c [Rhodospirillales bacterium]